MAKRERPKAAEREEDTFTDTVAGLIEKRLVEGASTAKIFTEVHDLYGFPESKRWFIEWSRTNLKDRGIKMVKRSRKGKQ